MAARKGMTLAQARRLALALPEAAEAPHFHFTSFRVGGKIFATAPPEATHLHVFVGEEDRQSAIAIDPHCTEALHWGKQVLGVRIALAGAHPGRVQALLRKAWARKAPKRLLHAAAQED